MTRHSALLLLMFPVLVMGLAQVQIAQYANMLIFQNSRESYAWIYAMSSISPLIVVPIATVLSDSIGRRPLLLAGFSASMLQCILLLIGYSLQLNIAVVLLGVLTSCCFTIFQSYCADITTGKNRAPVFLSILAVWTLGTIAGGATGTMSFVYGDVTLYGLLILLGAMLVAMYFILPESLKAENRKPFTWKEGNVIGTSRILFDSKNSTLIVVALMLGSAAVYAMTSISPQIIRQSMHDVDTRFLADSMLYQQLTSIAAAAFAVFMVFGNGKSKTVVTLLSIAAIGCLVIPFAPTTMLFRIANLLPRVSGAGLAIFYAMMIENKAPSQYATTLGGFASLAPIAFILGSANGTLYGSLIEGQFLWVASAVPAVLFLISIVVFTNIPKEDRQ